ncbi:MAG TPA: hypothetical protein VNT81_10745 [Vicinamibacterales bacterium]|nr:hypothetical protein [Vicinamibacterales bacterium]
MAVRYPGHWLKTRRQAVWQSAVLLVVLVPLVVLRFSTHGLNTALALAGLTMTPFAIAYQSWRFLEAQERVHDEPTAEMAFVFRFVVNTPVAIGGLLLVLMSSMG